MVKINPGFDGILNIPNPKVITESVNISNLIGSDNLGEVKVKANKIKKQIDDLMRSGDYDVIDTLYRLMVAREKQGGNQQPPQQMSEGDSQEYQRKAELIKDKIDFLSNNDRNDLLDKIDGIITKIHPNNESEIAEASPNNNETYFDTLSAALDQVRNNVAKKGYTVDEDDMWSNFGTGGISYGQTKRANISLLRDGMPQKNRSITVAIYRMDSGKYELTSYIN